MTNGAPTVHDLAEAAADNLNAALNPSSFDHGVQRDVAAALDAYVTLKERSASAREYEMGVAEGIPPYVLDMLRGIAGGAPERLGSFLTQRTAAALVDLIERSSAPDPS